MASLSFRSLVTPFSALDLPSSKGFSPSKTGDVSGLDSNDEDYDFPPIKEIVASAMPKQPQSRPLVLDLTSDSDDDDDDVSSAHVIRLPLFALVVFAYTFRLCSTGVYCMCRSCGIPVEPNEQVGRLLMVPPLRRIGSMAT